MATPTAVPAPTVWSVAQITEHYPVSISTVRRAITDGTLASFTIGRRRLIRGEALDAWLGGTTAEGAS